MDKYFDSMTPVELAESLLNSNIKDCSRCTQDGLKCIERGCIVDKVAERLKELSKDICSTVDELEVIKKQLNAVVTALASIKEIAENLELYINNEVHPAVDYCIYSSLIDDVQRIQNLIEESEKIK
ncbi:MAG: hypothetical protein IJE19_03315 [Clostridia bacterium]|nr:hypothetical protein [Clostridia bacterium]